MKKSFFLLAMLMAFLSANAQVQNGISYSIVNQKSSLLMGVNGSTTTGSPIVQQQDSMGETAWEFIAKPDGYFQIRNIFSGKYMSNMGSIVEGAVLKQTDAQGEGALWQLVPEGPGFYRFKNKLSNMLIATSGSTAEFSQLTQKPTVGGIGGNWKLVPGGNVPPQNGNETPSQDEWGGGGSWEDGDSGNWEEGGSWEEGASGSGGDLPPNTEPKTVKGSGGKLPPNKLPKPKKGGGGQP